MESRVRLKGSWSLWQKTKEEYNTAMLNISDELIKAKVTGVKRQQNLTHDDFADHLLDVHQQWCRPCGQGDTEGRDRVKLKVSTATQTDDDSASSTCPAPGPSQPTTSRFDSDTGETPAAPKDGSSGIPWHHASTPQSKRKGRVELISPIHPTIVLNQVRASEGLPPLPDDYSDSSDDGEEDDPVPLAEELPSSYENLHNMSLDEMVFQVEQDPGVQEQEEEEAEQEEDIQNCDGTPNDHSIEDLITSKKCIVYIYKLIEILRLVHGAECKRNGCGRDLAYTTRGQGTALIVKWACSAGHGGGTWSSQPKFKGLFAGNLEIASALVMSGNNFSKISLFARFCSLLFFSDTSFHRYQRFFIAPAVKKYWSTLQTEQLLQLQGKPVIIAGDGRNDSPGHSSQYCTYSFADATTGQIIHVEVVDVREAAGKSTNMERIGFERGMAYILNEVEVQSVVTDAHPQIMAIMKRSDKYAGIGHQIDVWHGGKNLTKKLTKVAADKSCRVLLPWIPAVRNHFWYVSRSCGNDANNLAVSLFGILHHICNEHEWGLCADGSAGKCQHDPLPEGDSETRQWLEKDSPAHRALERVLNDTRFKNTLPYYKDFLHTGKLESFHSHLLMYCSKLHSYQYQGYVMRNLLAVIDHNKHLNRPAATNQSGEVIRAKAFNRRTKRYVPTVVPVCKQYSYIHELMEMVFLERVARPGPMSVVLPMAADNPVRIFPNRYMVPAPSISQLVQEHISRFN